MYCSYTHQLLMQCNERSFENGIKSVGIVIPIQFAYLFSYFLNEASNNQT